MCHPILVTSIPTSNIQLGETPSRSPIQFFGATPPPRTNALSSPWPAREVYYFLGAGYRIGARRTNPSLMDLHVIFMQPASRYSSAIGCTKVTNSWGLSTLLRKIILERVIHKVGNLKTLIECMTQSGYRFGLLLRGQSCLNPWHSGLRSPASLLLALSAYSTGQTG